MQIILEANGLWEMMEPNEKTQADNKKEKTAIAFLYQALPEEQLLQITKHKTAKTFWDAFKTRHVGVNRVQQAKQQTLKSEFEMLQMEENESIDSFVTRLTGIINKAASVGLTYGDSTLVRKLLNAIPDRFLQIVASIEQYSDLDEMSLDEAIERLKTFEERLKYKNKRPVNTQESLLFTRHEDQGQQFRKRDHGGFNQSRGQENNFKKKQTTNQINLLMIRVRCCASNARSMGILQTNVHQGKKNNPISLKKTWNQHYLWQLLKKHQTWFLPRGITKQ
ncbi:hypothetical protein Tco_0566510 [Tanacetum coccineum]